MNRHAAAMPQSKRRADQQEWVVIPFSRDDSADGQSRAVLLPRPLGQSEHLVPARQSSGNLNIPPPMKNV